MKYKELPAFETNDFIVGDTVHYYNNESMQEFVVSKISRELLILGKTDYHSFDLQLAHYKQCRKLVEVKPQVPREIELYYDKKSGHYFQVRGNGNFETIKFREVIEDDKE